MRQHDNVTGAQYPGNAQGVTCAWYAMCDNVTTTAVTHPAFDAPVPICERCATMLGIVPTHDVIVTGEAS